MTTQFPHPEDINWAINSICVEKGIGPKEFSILMGEDPETFYSTAYRWMKGGMNEKKQRRVGPAIEVIPEIEDALGVYRGEILTRAGFITRRMSLADEIRMSGDLLDEDRQPLVDALLTAMERAKAERFKASERDRSKKSGDNTSQAI
jgi:hypothetical protein